MRFALGLSLVLVSGTAWAGAALDDGNSGTPTHTTDPTAAPESPTTIAEQKVEYGVDIRLRKVYVPQGLVELFVEHAAGGVDATGYGLDLVRKRGDLELQLGFEFEHLNPKEGVYINKGDNVPVDTADYILSPEKSGSQFGWFTLEFTFINHTPLGKHLAFRYGGGAGLGIFTGGLYRWDTQCAPTATNSNPAGCVPMQEGGPGVTLKDSDGTIETTPAKYDMPPVFFVVNAIIGLQIKPIEKMVINVEGGIRTAPFFGVSVGYFL